MDVSCQVEPLIQRSPVGHLDAGEDAITAAVRETTEEAGIRESQLNMRRGFQHNITYRMKPTPRDPTGIKTVAYFLAEVLPDTSVQISEEHTSYAWWTMEEVLANVKYAETVALMTVVRDELGRPP